jgi:uncharacterized protein YcaQ
LNTPFPLSAVRTLALHTQGLTKPNLLDARPNLARVENTVDQVKYVQIDTLNLLQRSQYIVLWSRLGNYSPGDFERLVYSSEERKLFEGVQGVAAIIPLKDYRYQIPRMDRERAGLINWYTRMLEERGGAELVPLVYQRIQQEGALRAFDFEYDGPKRGSW